MLVKELLIEKNCSIVASNGYFSYDTGIKPVISKIIEDRYFFKDLEVADKVIGKASAMLFVYSGVKKIYTFNLSKAGKKILDDYGIEYEYDKLVDYIINNKGDDMCPMEKTVKDIDDLQMAYEALYNKTALH